MTQTIKALHQRKSRNILILAVLMVLLIVSVWIYPRARSMYHLGKGGAYLSTVEYDISSYPCEIQYNLMGDQKVKAQQAKAHLERALNYGGNAQVLYLLGRLNCLLNDPNAAVNAYEHYHRLRPVNPLGAIELGFAYELSGQLSKAGEAWMTAGLEPGEFIDRSVKAFYQHQDLETSKTDLYRAIAMNGSSGLPHLLMGRIIEESGDQDEATIWIERGLSLLPDLDSFQDALTIARQYQDSRLTRILLEDAVQHFPEYVNFRYELARIYRGIGEKSMAKSIIDQALALDQSPEFQNLMLAASIYIDNNEPAAAVQTYQSATEVAANNAELYRAYFELGKAAFANGEGVDQAIAYIERAIAIDSKPGLPFFEIANFLAGERRFEEADRWIQEALSREPQTNWWFLRRADIARRSGDLPRAITLYEETVERFPGYALAYHQMAWAYHEIGRHQDAVNSIERSQELFAPDIPHWSHLRAALIYEASGDYEKALTSFEAVLTLQPGEQQAREGVARIRAIIP
jgi:tetratricopeptide (TPR) repeat protein